MYKFKTRVYSVLQWPWIKTSAKWKYYTCIIIYEWRFGARLIAAQPPPPPQQCKQIGQNFYLCNMYKSLFILLRRCDVCPAYNFHFLCVFLTRLANRIYHIMPNTYNITVKTSRSRYTFWTLQRTIVYHRAHIVLCR